MSIFSEAETLARTITSQDERDKYFYQWLRLHKRTKEGIEAERFGDWLFSIGRDPVQKKEYPDIPDEEDRENTITSRILRAKLDLFDLAREAIISKRTGDSAIESFTLADVTLEQANTLMEEHFKKKAIRQAYWPAQTAVEVRKLRGALQGWNKIGADYVKECSSEYDRDTAIKVLQIMSAAYPADNLPSLAVSQKPIIKDQLTLKVPAAYMQPILQGEIELS